MPSFFNASKENAQFRAQLAAAGFDVEAMLKASGDQHLKAAVDKRVADALAAAPASADASAAAETIAEAVKENGTLSAKVTDLSGKLGKADAIVGAVHGFLGAQPASAEDTTKALKAKVTDAATNIVAGAGHPGVDETIAAAGKSTEEQKKVTGKTGADRFVAALKGKLPK